MNEDFAGEDASPAGRKTGLIAAVFGQVAQGQPLR
jgi:hypothetical protein